MKRKVGRPSLPEHKKRNNMLRIRVSNGELNVLQSLADRWDMGLSETIRKAIELADEKE